MDDLRRELRINRIISVMVAVLLVCVLVVGIFVGMEIRSCTEVLAPVAEKAEEVDFKVLNETMVNLNETLSEIDWEQLSVQLSELDMDALNEAIEGLDTEVLSKALENLNSTVEALENFSNSIKSFFGK